MFLNLTRKLELSLTSIFTYMEPQYILVLITPHSTFPCIL